MIQLKLLRDKIDLGNEPYLQKTLVRGMAWIKSLF